MEKRREVAARNASDVGEQERQPGEQRELFDVHAADSDHVERNPEGEGLPGRLGQEAGDDDAEKPLVRKNRCDRRLGSGGRLAAGVDIRPLLGP